MSGSDFPGALDTFTTKTDGSGNPVYAAHINKLQNAVVAIEQNLKRGPVLFVAASTAPASIKTMAHYVCDGTADQVEINAALGALPLRDGYRAGVVMLSDGLFSLSGSITPATNQSLIGQGFGTTLALVGAANAYAINFTAEVGGNNSHARGIVIAEMHIDCNGGAQTGESGGVRATGANRCILHHLFITTPRNAGIYLVFDAGNAHPWANVIMGCTVTLGRNSQIASTQGWGIDCGDGEENLIAGCNFEFNGESHIVENVVGNNAIIGNSFVHGRAAASTNGIKSNGSRGRWIGNVFDSVPGHNMRVTGNENLIAENAMFLIGDTNAGNADGICLAFGASRNVIVNNRLSTHGTANVTRYLINDQLDGGGNTHQNLIAQNMLRQEGAPSGGSLVSRYGTSNDNTYRTNIGWRTEAWGAATITAGTSVVVTHGLGATPTRIFLTPSTSVTVGYYVSARTATTFTITLTASATVTFDWFAAVVEA